jgi:hypothetical protein
MYRLFIDETGTHDLSGAHDDNNRYLSLTGLIFNLRYIQRILEPELARFKQRHLPGDNPENIVLHRKEIVNKRGPFSVLRDVETERVFNRQLINLLGNLDYTAITVTLDKREHFERYNVWHKNPYHYCMEAMIERYCMHLSEIRDVGDIMIEARDKKLDKKLKANYQYFFKSGTAHMSVDALQATLSSREIKLERKEANVAGLQLADMIAHPACIAARRRRGGHPIPDNFGGRIAIVLQNKYRRSYRGRIDGYGRKWLP